MAGGPEFYVKQEVKKLLTKHGWWWWMPAAGAFGKGGASDFHALRDGVFLAVETKAGTKLTGKHKPTPMQIKFIRSVRVNGGRAMVVNESNLGLFEELIRGNEFVRKVVEASDDGRPS